MTIKAREPVRMMSLLVLRMREQQRASLKRFSEARQALHAPAPQSWRELRAANDDSDRGDDPDRIREYDMS